MEFKKHETVTCTRHGMPAGIIKTYLPPSEMVGRYECPGTGESGAHQFDHNIYQPVTF